MNGAKPDFDRVVWPVQPSKSPTRPVRRRPVDTSLMLPADVLLRHNARILDPVTAPQPKASRRAADNKSLGNDRGSGTVPYGSTAYVADQLLLTATGRNGQQLQSRVKELGGLVRESPVLRAQSIRFSELRPEDLRLADERARTGSPAVVRLLLISDSEESAPPPDAWEVIQAVRDLGGAATADLGLNHLLFAAGIGGVGFRFGHSVGGVGFRFGHAVGPGEYAVPGSGARIPLKLVGRRPTRRESKRRPVVAIIDTGVADHPWFVDQSSGASFVERLRYDAASGTVLPATAGADGGEIDPNLIDPLEGLIDPFFGHGTFIAGLIHQNCPDADICSIKAMTPEGFVEEAALLNSLGSLHQRQAHARQSGQTDQLIDIVSLSLGYYHEDDLAGVAYDARLKDTLDALGQLGVLVVAAAGNDATSRPLLPAGFSHYTAGVLSVQPGQAPLVSVGALNPDGGVALFSNSGDWVACYGPGAALVSTLPVVDAGQRPGVDLSTAPTSGRPVASWRATIDPDSFTSGFGAWSGTSFAAPVVAGASAQALLDGGSIDGDPVGRFAAALAVLGFPA